MNAMIYQPGNKWRLLTALTAAAAIHVAAVGFATTEREISANPPGVPGEPPELSFDPAEPVSNPPIDDPDPLPTPPAIDDSFAVDSPTPPPVRRPPPKLNPLVRPRSTLAPASPGRSGGREVALNAPRPDYPYEARRQKITGDGVALMTIDPRTGSVVGVTMAKSTGSAVLDNAAIAGFRRWRFKPGSASTVTCPVTFTLAGAQF